MAKVEQVKAGFYAQVHQLFLRHPNVIHEFDVLWSAEKFREAYLLVNETVKRLNLELPNDFKKADEAFYWEFVS